jgi:hypothetical protein
MLPQRLAALLWRDDGIGDDAMICSHRRCRALMTEDREFTAQMALYNFPQRRYVCAAGHTAYTGLETIRPVARDFVITSRPAATTEKHCQQCGETFIGITRQKYCGPACTRAADAARTRCRNVAKKSRLSPAALKAARAVPGSWQKTRVPVPYASRPKNLDQAWV